MKCMMQNCQSDLVHTWYYAAHCPNCQAKYYWTSEILRLEAKKEYLRQKSEKAERPEKKGKS